MATSDVYATRRHLDRQALADESGTTRITEKNRPVRFPLHLRVACPERSVGVGRSISDSHALRTSERATHRQKIILIVQVEKNGTEICNNDCV